MKSRLKNCLNCGVLFWARNIGKINEAKFCGMRCRTRYSANKRYQKIKNDPKLKRQRYEYLKKWISKNREHFNDLMREPQRLRSNKRRKEWKRKGLCTICGGKRDSPFLRCNKCRKKHREWYKKRGW